MHLKLHQIYWFGFLLIFYLTFSSWLEQLSSPNCNSNRKILSVSRFSAFVLVCFLFVSGHRNVLRLTFSYPLISFPTVGNSR